MRLLEIEGNNIQIMIEGSCAACTSAPMTFRYGIAAEIRKHIPSVTRIIGEPFGFIEDFGTKKQGLEF